MTYEECLTYLYESQPAFHLIGAKAYKPGLENTYKLMEHLGNPHVGLRCVHVAGTNGKGSTSHLIAATLQAAGYRVGLYTSPHLVDFRERIRINGQMISREDVTKYVTDNQHFLDTLKPSFFESTMGMAFWYFAKERVDVAVVEVGLGGRLDSTNIISPLLSVITNIGMDHTEFLGHTLEAIAGEKAGIIKPDTPVVIGETQAETAPVFLQRANETGSPIVFADQQADVQSVSVQLADICQLKGAYQTKNIQTAYCAILQLRSFFTITDDAINQGFAHVCDMTGLRGRWEIINQVPLTICDTGHNSHGIRYVAEQLSQYENLNIVFGMVNDKDVEVVLNLLPKHAHYFFTQAATHRAIPAEELITMAEKFGLNGTSYNSVEEAIQSAQNNTSPNGVIFIGGSNYVVGEALSLLH